MTTDGWEDLCVSVVMSSLNSTTFSSTQKLDKHSQYSSTVLAKYSRAFFIFSFFSFFFVTAVPRHLEAQNLLTSLWVK